MGAGATTSTTMMMDPRADALAIALLERKGFSSGRFPALSTPAGGTPGGGLLPGARYQWHVGDEDFPLVSFCGKCMSEAILMMTGKRSFGCAGICDPRGRLIGVITDGRICRRHMGEALLGQKDGPRKVMHPPPEKRSQQRRWAVGRHWAS